MPSELVRTVQRQQPDGALTLQLVSREARAKIVSPQRARSDVLRRRFPVSIEDTCGWGPKDVAGNLAGHERTVRHMTMYAAHMHATRTVRVAVRYGSTAYQG